MKLTDDLELKKEIANRARLGKPPIPPDVLTEIETKMGLKIQCFGYQDPISTILYLGYMAALVQVEEARR